MSVNSSLYQTNKKGELSELSAMRIRKHAKVSPLTYAASGAFFQAQICQLNQSPWDVMTFPREEEDGGSPSMLLSPPEPTPSPPPPPLKFLLDGCESYPPNGSFKDSNEVVQSAESAMPSPGGGYSSAAAEQEEPPILCCKTDGKAWKCKREAKEGHTFCEHHLEQLKHYNNLAHPTWAAATAVKKSEKQTPAAEEAAATTSNRGRRPRPKKPSASSSNPYELYYYTGFGPLWGKKRGPGRTSSTANNLANTSGNGTTSSASEMDDGEFDYVEDDFEDDDDDDESDDGKRKKARKPIKARSLKSLM